MSMSLLSRSSKLNRATSRRDAAAYPRTAGFSNRLQTSRTRISARASEDDVSVTATVVLDDDTTVQSPKTTKRKSEGYAGGYEDELKEYKVLVAGATGGVGRRVVELLDKVGVPTRALVRDKEKGLRAIRTRGENVDLVKGDVFQYATLPAAAGDSNAIICCTGASDPSDPFGPFNVDYQGTVNLIALAKQKKMKKFILVTSIGTDEIMNPLNLFWGVLFWKKRAEEELQRSGLEYTIIRPGGLRNELMRGESRGEIVTGYPNEYGFPPMKRSGSILRDQVAEVCVCALAEPAATNKVVEIIADSNAPHRSMKELFDRIHF